VADIDFKDVRVLIVGGKPHAAQILRTVLGIVGINSIVVAPSTMLALSHLQTRSFDAVFCDEAVEPADGVPFVLAARRAPGLMNPMVPLFLTCHGPRKAEVFAARDVGVTDVLARPISAGTVRRKIAQALKHPRNFIAASEFFGPDRRGKERPAFQGSDRRTRQTRKLKMGRRTDDVTMI
jgi:DNA-binding NtrC family response regulator